MMSVLYLMKRKGLLLSRICIKKNHIFSQHTIKKNKNIELVQNEIFFRCFYKAVRWNQALVSLIGYCSDRDISELQGIPKEENFEEG